MSKRKRNYNEQKKKPLELLSIVICVYGRFDLLQKCLDAIPNAAGSIAYNIVLVDNNSPDQEEANVFYNNLRDDPKIAVLRNKQNLGFPRACNIGARRCNSPLLLMLNSDVILQPDSINLMVKALDDPKIGAVGMKLLFPDDAGELRQNVGVRPSGKVQHVGLATNVRGEFFHVFLGWSPDHPKVNKVRDAYAVTGAALMTRKYLWNKIGGFNEDYGMGTYEDVDYCLTVRDLGYNIVVETKAVGVHYTGATAEKYGIPYPMDMNRLLLLRKWAKKLNWTEYNHW